MAEIFQAFSQADATYVNVYNGFFRYASLVLIVILLWRCGKPLLTFRREPEIWAWL